MFVTMRKISILLLLLLSMVIIMAGGTVAEAAVKKSNQKSFASPEEALKSLVNSARNSDTSELVAILGPGSQEIISSGDPVADKAGLEKFVKLCDEKLVIEGAESGRAVFSIGNENYPYPIPVMKQGNVWRFDVKAGKDELLNRRIGRNELAVIEVLHAYADAQREYAAKDWNGDGKSEFAQKFRSSPGKKDGLYWAAREGEEESPFGPMVAKADSEGYARSKGGDKQPYQGYLFKILKAQGASAEGGAFDYVVNGRMILGFGLVAYPAQYGASGIMTFVVNQNGIVYQKNLGKNTAKTAATMKRYNPDSSWKKVE